MYAIVTKREILENKMKIRFSMLRPIRYTWMRVYIK